MREIELSSMYPTNLLGLDKFASSTFINVRHQQYTWEEGWNRIMQVGIYQKGPDVSQVGSTWLENMVDMHALRPFSVQEVAQFGGKEAFLPAAWETGTHGSYQATSIPWMADTRNIYIRKDLCARAGVDPKAAVESPEAFLDALRKLRSSGTAQYPLAIPTSSLIIHFLASWIWGYGGNFRTDDGHKMTMLEPAARRGVIDYFKMGEFIHPSVRLHGTAENELAYYHGDVAILCSGHWVGTAFKNQPETLQPVVRENTGMELTPGGIPYVGGSHLVIWRHSLHDVEDLALIKHLLSDETQLNLTLLGGGFPSVTRLYKNPVLANDPIFSKVIDSMNVGRSVQSSYRWASLETRVNDFILKMWSDLFANPELNIEKEVDQRLKALCDRLEKTLLASW